MAPTRDIDMVWRLSRARAARAPLLARLPGPVLARMQVRIRAGGHFRPAGVCVMDPNADIEAALARDGASVLAAGELLVLGNARWLHGRDRLSHGSGRFLRRYWLRRPRVQEAH